MTLEADLQTLREVAIFRGIDPARLRLLAFGGDRLGYDEGATLFRQREVSDATYLIIEGKVEVWLEQGGNSVKIAELGSGALVGEMGVLCDRPRSATIRAATHVVALRIARDTFFDMLRQFPQMSLAIMRELARRETQAMAGRHLEEGAITARVAQ